jgi:hypothetical protein
VGFVDPRDPFKWLSKDIAQVYPPPPPMSQAVTRASSLLGGGPGSAANPATGAQAAAGAMQAAGRRGMARYGGVGPAESPEMVGGSRQQPGVPSTDLLGR